MKSFTPENEIGVIVIFSRICREHGFEIVSIGERYPDALIQDVRTGDVFRAEFEYTTSNFTAHGHDPRGCDLVICWKNDVEGFLLPIIEVSNPSTFEFVVAAESEKEIMYLRGQNARLNREVKRLSQPVLIDAGSKRTDTTLSRKLGHGHGSTPPPGEGWRIEFHKGGRYFVWRRGGGRKREHVYGGKRELLSDDVLEKYSKTRKVLRD